MPPVERRAAIVEAATPLFLELGENATTKQLANAAGISEGTIFNVFADKEELIDAVVAAVLDPERFEIALASLDPRDDFESRLVAATAIVQQRMMEIWGLFSALGPRTRRPPRPVPESPALSAIFESDPSRVRIPPEQAARMLRAMTVALTHPMMADKPSPPSEIVDAFLNGLGVRR